MCSFSSFFPLTKCTNWLHLSTFFGTSLFLHTHSWLLYFFFSLLVFSLSFHLIVHPRNFLIRLTGRTREHSAACRLLCSFLLPANTSGRLVFCIIVVLLFFFFFSSSSSSSSLPSFASSPSSSSSPFHTHPATHTSLKWSAVKNWLVDNCRRRSTFLRLFMFDFFVLISCVTNTFDSSFNVIFIAFLPNTFSNNH